jgi:hypothetical protein
MDFLGKQFDILGNKKNQKKFKKLFKALGV